MAVIPSGTSEPWHWAAREAAANDALSRLFVQENMRREMQQNQFGENARNRDWRAGQQDKSLDWQGRKLDQQQEFTRGENQLNRENAWNMTQYRVDNRSTTGKAGKYQVIYGDDVLQAWHQIEEKYKLPQGYLASIVGPESAGGANTVSKVSNARGPFQFMPKTAAQYGLSNPGDKFDPIKSAEAAARLAADNRELATKMSGNAIRWTGGPQDIGKLYMLHQQGVEGGYRLLLPANATRQAFQVGVPANLMNNGVNSSMTAQQVVEMWEKKLIPWYQSYTDRSAAWGGGGGQQPQQQASMQQPPAPASQSTQLNAPNTGRPTVSAPADPRIPPTASAPPVQTQSTPATNPSQPSASQQPEPFKTQPQPGGGSVPPSTISTQVQPQPPAAVDWSAASMESPATAPPANMPMMPKTGDTSTQTTPVSGAPAGAMGDRGTPSLPGGQPAPGTRKKVTKYIDENGVLRFSAPQ